MDTMAYVEKPKTLKEQVDQIWMVLIGSNGDGIAAITKENRKDIQEIKMKTQRFVDTRFDTCPTKIWLENMWDDRKKSRERKIDVRLVVYGLIVGLIASAPTWMMLFRSTGG